MSFVTLPDGSPSWSPDNLRESLPGLVPLGADFSTADSVAAALGRAGSAGVDYGPNGEIPAGYAPITAAQYKPYQDYANRNADKGGFLQQLGHWAGDFAPILALPVAAAFAAPALAGLSGAAPAAAVSVAELGTVELGLIATPATAQAAISAGIAPALLAGGPGALTLQAVSSALPLVDIAGIATPELGLIATPETAAAAIQAGIPAELLAGGPGAITLESLAQLPQLPTLPRSASFAPAATTAAASGGLGSLGSLLAPLAGAVRSLLGGARPSDQFAYTAPAAAAPGRNLLILAAAAGAAWLVFKGS